MLCPETGFERSSRAAKGLIGLVVFVCFFQFLRSVDFSDYYRRTAEAVAGQFSHSPYPVDKGNWGDFFQSPVVVLGLVPLTFLPLLAAKLIWALGNVASLYYIARRTVERGLDFRQAFFFVLVFAHALSDVFLSGNINMPLFLLCVAGWDLIHRKEIRYELAGGICFGLAILIKVQPAMFLAWFALTNRPRKAGWIALGVAFLVLLSWLLLPFGTFGLWWKGWSHALSLYPFAAGPGLVSYQSPPAVLYRFVNGVFHMSPSSAFSLASTFALLIQGSLFVLAWVFVRRGADENRVAFPLLCSAFFLGGPFSWALTALFLFPLVYRAAEDSIPWPMWFFAGLYAVIPKALWPAELWQRMAEASLPGLCLAGLALFSVGRLLPKHAK